ncbi:phospholipid-binding protein MlaC [Rhodosalinus sp. K401]|uniref:MlaC/ttg2D family ABC transporter substrate-binding protein n=1 Tax=Rhodosalinus sp. K401 TaxID=3239195 RepID=UPI003523ECC2
MATDISRRGFLAGAISAASLAPRPAFALTEGRARGLVDSLVEEINAVISSGRSERQMYPEFERIFRRYADVPTIAAYALGVDRRRASEAQMRAFTEAFTGYISRKYGKRFREFSGGRLEVETVSRVKNYYQVRTTAYLPGQSPFIVDFHVSDRSGRDLFFNMFIEGVNMLLTEREEIGAMLDRRGGDIDRLIAELRGAG